MSSKNRKLYQMGKMSIREFYAHNTRWLAESTTPESVFEKPYLDEDRGRMHADIPTPDWPSMPPVDPWPPQPPIEGPVPGLPDCAIVCYWPLDCEEPVWCHPSIWCGEDLNCTLCKWVVEGATRGYTPHGTGGAWGIDVWIDSTLVEPGGEALIEVCMTDPCGNVCCEDVEITCKVCPPETVISWDDDLSADTIAQGNGGLESATITVKDGLGPYSWSVAGTGFSLLHSETIGVGNTLQADASSCGTATITVTDYCDDVATGYVRGAVGQWTEIPFTECTISGDPDTPGGNIKTKDKWRLTEEWGNACSTSLSDFYDGYYNCTEGYNLCANNSCKCDTGAGCHATMKCTKCLNTSKCAAGYTLCVDTATCICCGADSSGGCLCVDSDINRCYLSGKCMRDTAKLEEWTC